MSVPKTGKKLLSVAENWVIAEGLNVLSSAEGVHLPKES